MGQLARWDINSRLTATRDEARSRLNDRLEIGRALNRTKIGDRTQLKEALYKRSIWNEYNRHLLSILFDTYENSKEYDRVMNIVEKPEYDYGYRSLEYDAEWFHDSMETGVLSLFQLIERLDLYQDSQTSATESADIRTPSISSEKKMARTESATCVNTNRVFLVHGHDEGMKEAVARLIEKLRLKAVILHEQPSESKTLIEKLEAFSNVDYVVVLLSPDDIGASGEGHQILRPRARQNVVFEMGYFIGILTRKRVCALVKGGIEIQSDINGVVFIRMDDSGAWRLSLSRELKKAGFKIDIDDVL